MQPLSNEPLRLRRALPWAALVLLLLVAQSLLVRLTLDHEQQRAQERVEAAADAADTALRQRLLRLQQNLQGLGGVARDAGSTAWAARADALLREHRELLRLERRGPHLQLAQAVDSPLHPVAFRELPRDGALADTQLACNDATRSDAPAASRSFFVPSQAGLGQEVLDLCLPLRQAGQAPEFLVATVSLNGWLAAAVAPPPAGGDALAFSLVEADGSHLARLGAVRGRSMLVAQRILPLPGGAVVLRADSLAGRPSLIPHLTTALVLGLSAALFGTVALLARDVRRRARAERALADTLAIRKAMEDSLSTGLRARDLQGRLTYVNPAFCRMVGFTAAELLGQAEPPYWPAERRSAYLAQQAQRHAAGAAAPQGVEGFESQFVRRDGERFPVMIYEAPLVDGQGRHGGWMSAVVDLSPQRRVEDLARAQQERLQATARLATVGEMASLLSHELNQPLSAIASYAAGSLNLADDPDALALMRQGLKRIEEQAERAGRVIKSVQDFARHREPWRETLLAARLFDDVMPLVELQARKLGAKLLLDVPTPAPRVLCDRTLIEQVLLNLARNGLQAMEDSPPGARHLQLAVRQTHANWVLFSVTDSGPGLAPEVARKLFTPFFTTRAQGMGLGLSLCRSVVEQHGGQLDFESPAPGQAAGTAFRFTLPAAKPAPPASPEPAP